MAKKILKDFKYLTMKLFILDTEHNSILGYEPGTDNTIWTYDEAEAHNFRTETTEYTTQLNALNAIHPDRYVGASGAGVPK